MRAGAVRGVAAGVVSLAFVLMAVGPCLCLLEAQECHRDVEAAETADHACCEKPAGVQSAGDECCNADTDLVAAATDVPELSPPAFRAGPIGQPGVSERLTLTSSVPTLPPPPLDRTTVLLI